MLFWTHYFFLCCCVIVVVDICDDNDVDVGVDDLVWLAMT